MQSSLLRLYQHLPAPLRTVVASARGYYLRAWRYDRHIEDAVEAILERDRWSEAQWQAWQQERLARMLHHAATEVPFYRDRWQRRRRAGDRASWDQLANWPVLQKSDVRETPRAFISDRSQHRRLFHEHTSGTTGTPVELWFGRDAVVGWYAIYEARARRWFGVTQKDRWANIGGQQVVAFDRTKPPFWVWNAGLRQLYMSSYHLARQFVGAYVEAMRDHRIAHALGYSSSLHSLSHMALELGLECPRLRNVTCNAEPVYEFQRETIEKAFGVRPRETYGMSEIACAAGECGSQRLHLWPEVGVVEIRADAADAAVATGDVGRIICTGLLNMDMPLIRYEVGDRGALAEVTERCDCQRTLPILRSVEGRIDDVLITRDGRRIGRLDPVFKSDLPIREAQIIQDSLDSVRILVVAAAGYADHHGLRLAASLRERMGDVRVQIELVPEIQRTPNGKFRAVINRCATPAS